MAISHVSCPANEVALTQVLSKTLDNTALTPEKVELATLVHDNERFWIDGKRYVIDLATFRMKLWRRARRIFVSPGVD